MLLGRFMVRPRCRSTRFARWPRNAGSATRIQAAPGLGGDGLTFTRDQLAEAWGYVSGRISPPW